MSEELNLSGFTGTNGYTKVPMFSSVITDGVAYLMGKGYSWFITDTLAVIDYDEKVKSEEFLSIKLKLNGSEADMIITDGNEKVLYKQHYKWTDVKTEVQLYATNKVLMLSSEY